MKCHLKLHIDFDIDTDIDSDIDVGRPGYTEGEVRSQSLWSRNDRHFVGIT